MIYFLDIFVIPLNFAQKIAGEWIVSMQKFENKNIWCLMEHKNVWDVLQKDVQFAKSSYSSWSKMEGHGHNKCHVFKEKWNDWKAVNISYVSRWGGGGQGKAYGTICYL